MGFIDRLADKVVNQLLSEPDFSSREVEGYIKYSRGGPSLILHFRSDLVPKGDLEGIVRVVHNGALGLSSILSNPNCPDLLEGVTIKRMAGVCRRLGFQIEDPGEGVVLISGRKVTILDVLRQEIPKIEDVVKIRRHHHSS